MSKLTSAEFYATLTDQVRQAMVDNPTRWTQPWRNVGGFPTNVATGRRYNGINPLLCMLASAGNGYRTEMWGTYKQWKAKGYQVAKGEKGTTLILWKPIVKKGKDGAEDETFFLFRTFNVFNADQLTDPPEVEHHDTPTEDETIAALSAIGYKLDFGGDRASYSPSKDQVSMPHASQFHDWTGFVGTLAHETVHATGHKSRLDRDMANVFGSEDYAAEELVAELGAVFLAAALGVETQPRPDHAAYMASWLEALDHDDKWFYRAAKLASAAAEYVLAAAGIEAGTVPDREPEPVQDELALV